MAPIIGIMFFVAGAALLHKMVKRKPANSMKWSRETNGQIIEIDDYEILDDQKQEPVVYKVTIQ